MKRHRLPAGAIQRARRLRRSATPAEQRLWYALRERLPDAEFRQQVPFGPNCYCADFASHGAKLVIEVDGGQHSQASDRDAARTRFLEGEGYRVLRFWNNEVMENIDGVLAVIEKALSPCGRELGEGPAASAADKTPQTPASAANPEEALRAPASGRHPSPPALSHKGRGRGGQPPVGVR